MHARLFHMLSLNTHKFVVSWSNEPTFNTQFSLFGAGFYQVIR